MAEWDDKMAKIIKKEPEEIDPAVLDFFNHKSSHVAEGEFKPWDDYNSEYVGAVVNDNDTQPGNGGGGETSKAEQGYRQAQQDVIDADVTKMPYDQEALYMEGNNSNYDQLEEIIHKVKQADWNGIPMEKKCRDWNAITQEWTKTKLNDEWRDTE